MLTTLVQLRPEVVSQATLVSGLAWAMDSYQHKDVVRSSSQIAEKNPRRCMEWQGNKGNKYEKGEEWRHRGHSDKDTVRLNGGLVLNGE